MQIRYYLSWYNHSLPEKLVSSLKKDIKDFQSLVMISGQPTSFEEEHTNVVKDLWLTPAGLTFEENYLIDYRVPQAEAIERLKKASVIFLCGGIRLNKINF